MRSFLLAILIACLTACSSDKDHVPAAPPAPVRVAAVEQRALNRSITAVGNVQPSVSVAITPRVDGEILDIYFKEGDNVTEGQPLIRIDPRPYAAELAEKKALLAKSEAQLSKARHDRQRYGKLAQGGYISREAYEQTATDAQAISATVAADRAAVERAALDLSYCDISAPVSGRIGELKLHKGNMVKNNDSSPIAIIDTIAPCYVAFSIPELYLPAILSQLRKHEINVTAMPVEGPGATGALTLLDNRVDTKTGTIHLRATFANKPVTLWPGQFVEIQLPLAEKTDALLVPTNAIGRSRDETFVYVVDKDGKADYRKIKPLFESGEKTAVEGELKPGEQIVIDGMVRLFPGAKVQIIGDNAESQ